MTDATTPSDRPPRVFISYSWESDAHKAWVLAFATELVDRGGVDVVLDQWHLHDGDDKTYFMEQSVTTSDYVLVVCTPAYAQKADDRTGAVGYEAMILTGALAGRVLTRKFIPVLRAGTWEDAIPLWLGTKIGPDMRGDPCSPEAFEQLLRTLYGAHPRPPERGPRPNFATFATPRLTFAAASAPGQAYEAPISTATSIVNLSSSPKEKPERFYRKSKAVFLRPATLGAVAFGVLSLFAAGFGIWSRHTHRSHGTPASVPVTSSPTTESPRVNGQSPKPNTPLVSQGASTVPSAVKKDKATVAPSVDRSLSTNPKHSPPAAPAPKLAWVPKAFPPASAKPSNAPAQEQPSHAESSPQVKQAISAPEVNLFRKLFGTKPLQPGAPPATASSASSTEVHQQPSAGAQLNTEDYQYEDAKQARERALAPEDQPVVDASALGAQARQLYSAKKYTDALPIAKRACGLNNATGCLITAQMYQYGEGEMPPSINDAIPFYRQACDENSADGCFRLAVVFAAQGFHSQADALWQRACDLHDPEGCQRVGVHYLREKDYDKALVFLGRACDANLPYSCGDLGSIYEHSPALPDNKKQALQFYTKACTLGDAEACKRRKHLKL